MRWSFPRATLARALLASSPGIMPAAQRWLAEALHMLVVVDIVWSSGIASEAHAVLCTSKSGSSAAHDATQMAAGIPCFAPRKTCFVNPGLGGFQVL